MMYSAEYMVAKHEIEARLLAAEKARRNAAAAQAIRAESQTERPRWILRALAGLSPRA